MIILWITTVLIALNLSYINTQTITGSTCAIMNRNMYIVGGKAQSLNSSIPYGNMVTIDLTKAFEVAKFELKDDTNVDVSALGGGTGQGKGTGGGSGNGNSSGFTGPDYGAIFGTGVNGTRLWMYGGKDYNKANTPLRYFDLDTGGFNSHTTIDSPPNRYAFSYISHNGNFCVIGGILSENNTVTNEYWRFNITALKWVSMPSLEYVNGLAYSMGVYLNGHQIIIMGGMDNNGEVQDLSKVYIFDFNTLKWSMINTKGDNKYPMVKFMPIVHNNKIYIQGGANQINTNSSDFTIYSDLLELDITTWNWRKIKLQSQDNISTSRADYSAWLIGDQYVQFLGQTTGDSMQAQVIDLKTLTLAKKYVPPPLSFYTQAYEGDYDDDSTSSLSIGAIIGIVIACVVFVLLILAIIYLIYRNKKIKTKGPETTQDFLEPIQPVLNPVWSSNDGTNALNSNHNRTSHFSNHSSTPLQPVKFHELNKSYNPNSSSGGNGSNGISTLVTSSSSLEKTSPLERSEVEAYKEYTTSNPLFELRTDTILPGDDNGYNTAINEKFC